MTTRARWSEPPQRTVRGVQPCAASFCRKSDLSVFTLHPPLQPAHQHGYQDVPGTHTAAVAFQHAHPPALVHIHGHNYNYRFPMHAFIIKLCCKRLGVTGVNRKGEFKAQVALTGIWCNISGKNDILVTFHDRD